MRDRILNDLKEAMKAQDKETLSVIRMVKGAMQLEEISKGHQLTDEEVISVIAKEIKSRQESIAEFSKANRTDLVNQNEKEVAILNKYMPEQLSISDVEKIIEEAFAFVKPKSSSDMGKIMGYVTPKLKGRADLKLVSANVKERISNL